MKAISSKKFWLFFAAMILLEFVLFSVYVHRYITPIYPQFFDQSDYLKHTYQLFLSLKGNFPYQGSTLIFNGILFQLLTIGLFFLFGASRFIALCLGFIFFALLQLTLVLAALKHFQSKTLVFLLWGMVVGSASLYGSSQAGTLFDFRMDFSALCLYGVLVNLFVLSECFTKKSVNVWVVLAIVLLIGVRFITASYVILFFAFYLGARFLQKNYVIPANEGIHFKKINMDSRVRGDDRSLKNEMILLGITILTLLFFGAIFYKSLCGYYLVGHVTGDEKQVRLAEQGIHTFWDVITYYPVNFWKVHLGIPLKYYVLVLAVLTAIQLVFAKTGARKFFISLKQDRYCLGFVCFILSAYVILTLDEVKSTVVFSIIITAFWWLVCELLFRARAGNSLGKAQSVMDGLFIFVGITGFYLMLHYLILPPKPDRFANNFNISNAYIDIANRASSLKKDPVTISFDKISGALNYTGITNFYFETTHHWVNFQETKLGGQIFAVSQADALQALMRSDFVLFSDHCENNAFGYPLEQSVAQLRPVLNVRLQKYFVPVNHYDINHCQFILWQKKT